MLNRKTNAIKEILNKTQTEFMRYKILSELCLNLDLPWIRDLVTYLQVY